MADKNKILSADEKQTANLLEEHVAGGLLKQMPEATRGWVKALLGVAAQTINGMVGQQAGKFAMGFGKTEEQRAKYAIWGERTGRGAMTILPANIMPAIRIGKDFFANNKNIQTRFSQALQAEGKGSSLFGLNTDLEVVKFERDRNAKSTTLRAQGWFMGLIPSLPTLAINEMQMRFGQAQREYRRADHEKIIADYTKKKTHTSAENAAYDTSVRALATMDKDDAKAGGILTDMRRKQAQGLNSFLDKYKFIPDTPGSAEGFENLVRLDPTYLGKKENMSRKDFFDYAEIRMGMVFKGLIEPQLAKLVGDKFTPKAKALMSKPSAAEMIIGLQDFLKDNPSPLRVTVGKKSCSLEEYIAEIYKQNHADQGRKPLSEEKEEELLEACKAVAEAMIDPNRKLSAQGLIYLVDGKRGIGIGSFKQGDELESLIQSCVDRGMSTRVKPKAGQEFANAGFSQEEFFASWQNLSEDEKLVWSCFFTNEQLAKGGVPKEEIKTLRRGGNDKIFEVITETFLEVKQLSQQEMEDAGIDAKFARQIGKFLDKLESNRHDAENYLRERREEAMKLTAAIGVKLENDRPGFLSKILEAAEERKESGNKDFSAKVKQSRKAQSRTDEDEELPEGGYHASRLGKKSQASHRDRAAHRQPQGEAAYDR